MWCLHDKVQSTVIPRNVVELRIGIVLLSCSIIISIWFVFLVVKCTNCVFEKFNESKLFLNHSFRLVNIDWILFLKSDRLECDIKTLVSFANKIGVNFTLISIGKSFIKRRKSKGPNMELLFYYCTAKLQHLKLIPYLSFSSCAFISFLN